MEYTLKEHKHRFAVWTAARAVQRSWTTTLKISQVIHAVKLSEFVSTFKTLTGQQDFDDKHIALCDRMIDEFRLIDIEASYGRMAKIVAVYLKTSIIICAEADNDKIRLIHPPIDRILLKNLPANINFDDIKNLNWTQLDKNAYWNIVKIIRERLGVFDWRLEMAWRPEIEKN